MLCFCYVARDVSITLAEQTSTIKEKLLLALERQGELTEKIDKEKKSALKETLDRLKSQKQQMEQTIHYIEDLLDD